jgi:hypothetical protein
MASYILYGLLVPRRTHIIYTAYRLIDLTSVSFVLCDLGD